MSKLHPHGDLSLKWLELFDICATKGSMQAAATETGLSASTVSHHITRLETALGVQLLDHSKRPLAVTSAGLRFQRKIAGALNDIRAARADAVAGSVEDATYLRIGLIEDFDSDVAPVLAVKLAQDMPKCDFLYYTDSSHTIIEMLRNRALDIGVIAHSAEDVADLHDEPILRDPYVVIAPLSGEHTAESLLSGQTDLPFLRFSSSLHIGRQIETQLRRHGLRLGNRFECANSNTIMAMVSAGAGWSITSALLYAHGEKFHEAIGVHPFSGKNFARQLSVVSTPDCAQSLRQIVKEQVHDYLGQNVLPSVHANLPWLGSQFTLAK